MTFRDSFLLGKCEFEQIHDFIESWHNGAGKGLSLREYLGLSEAEYAAFLLPQDSFLHEMLMKEQNSQRFRIYQLNLDCDTPLRHLMFQNYKAFVKHGHAIPDASGYKQVYEGELFAMEGLSEADVLESIYTTFNTNHPEDYTGRSLSVSDIVELIYEDNKQAFFCDMVGFCKIEFDSQKAPKQ